MVYDIWTDRLFELFSIVGTEIAYNILGFGDRFGLGLRAYFLQNNCHYIMIIYTVINPE
jgi:hypothetical protein